MKRYKVRECPEIFLILILYKILFNFNIIIRFLSLTSYFFIFEEKLKYMPLKKRFES